MSEGLTLDEYQRRATKTAIYPRDEGVSGLVYCALGAAGETGEMANKVKKILRDDSGLLTAERQEELIDEAGDCLWYISQVCRELGISLGSVAQQNLEKLTARAEKGTLKGSGDKR